MNDYQELPWLALFTLAIAAVITTVIVFSARHERRRDEEVQRVWKAFAREHGLRWREVARFWFSRGYEVHGESSGVSVTVQKHVVRTGKHAVTYTRFIGRLPRPVESPIHVGRRSFFTKLGEWIGWRTVTTDDPEFDSSMAVRSRAPHAALEIVDSAVRERFLRFERRAEIQCKASEAKLWWRGAETDPQVLESALGIIVALCGADTAARPHAMSR